MKTDMYKNTEYFPVVQARCNMIACWYNFEKKSLPPGAFSLTCKTHKNAIPHKKKRLV